MFSLHQQHPHSSQNDRSRFFLALRIGLLLCLLGPLFWRPGKLGCFSATNSLQYCYDITRCVIAAQSLSCDTWCVGLRKECQNVMWFSSAQMLQVGNVSWKLRVGPVPLACSSLSCGRQMLAHASLCYLTFSWVTSLRSIVVLRFLHAAAFGWALIMLASLCLTCWAGSVAAAFKALAAVLGGMVPQRWWSFSKLPFLSSEDCCECHCHLPAHAWNLQVGSRRRKLQRWIRALAPVCDFVCLSWHVFTFAALPLISGSCCVFLRLGFDMTGPKQNACSENSAHSSIFLGILKCRSLCPQILLEILKESCNCR